MKTMFALTTGVSAIVSLMLSKTGLLAQAEIMPQNVKDITVAGLLLIAVIYLYRELKAERTKNAEFYAAQNQQTTAFVAEQTRVIKQAAESQSAALGKVAQALSTLEDASRQQVTIYREHINTILERATHK